MNHSTILLGHVAATRERAPAINSKYLIAAPRHDVLQLLRLEADVGTRGHPGRGTGYDATQPVADG
jgi:hypothetical protein